MGALVGGMFGGGFGAMGAVARRNMRVGGEKDVGGGQNLSLIHI